MLYLIPTKNITSIELVDTTKGVTTAKQSEASKLGVDGKAWCRPKTEPSAEDKACSGRCRKRPRMGASVRVSCHHETSPGGFFCLGEKVCGPER